MHVDKLHRAIAGFIGPAIDKVIADKDIPWRKEWSIAGGFTRDVLLGLPPKDIDVVLEQPFVHDDVTWSAPTERDYQHGSINTVGTSRKLLPVDTEFIVRTGVTCSPYDLVQYHCCGLSNAIWNRGTLILDETFLSDVSNRVVRASPKCNRLHETTAINEYLTRIYHKLKPLGYTLELRETHVPDF